MALMMLTNTHSDSISSVHLTRGILQVLSQINLITNTVTVVAQNMYDCAKCCLKRLIIKIVGISLPYNAQPYRHKSPRYIGKSDGE